MLRTYFIRRLFTVGFYVLVHAASAQESVLTTGKRSIALDEPFTVTLLISGDSTAEYPPFPAIPGLLKREASVAIRTEKLSGNNVTVRVITQNYLAPRPGTYPVEPIRLTVNGETLTTQQITLTVGPPQNPDYSFDPGLYDELVELERKAAFAEVKEDAFFALTTDKKEVYTGEGFLTSLALYVAETNKAELQSYQVADQLIEILKKIRPANCWEENFNIEEFRAVPVTINEKKYARYAIYQAVFYPLNDTPIQFPEVGLTMIKYRTVPDKATGQPRKAEEYRTFYTLPQQIRVKPLPPHPLREKIPVGVFRLQEEISNHRLQTGESFNYQFRITGEGNVSALTMQAPDSSADFDFYPPAIRQQVNHTGNKAIGTKSFLYQVVPRAPGQFALQDYFSLIYFNPQQEQYDTLASAITVRVSGERKAASALLQKPNRLYENIAQESTRMRSLDSKDWVNRAANLFLAGMLLVTVALLFMRR